VGLGSGCETIELISRLQRATRSNYQYRRNNLVLTLIMLGKLEEARQIHAANWRLNAPPHANTTPRIAFLRHLTALLESQPDTPLLGQLKTLLTGPEPPVASEVEAAKSKLAKLMWFGMVLKCLPEQLSAQAVAE